MPNLVDADTEEETENPENLLGGLGRSLSEIQLDNNLVCTILPTCGSCLWLTYSQPGSCVTSKQQRGDTEVCYFDRVQTDIPIQDSGTRTSKESQDWVLSPKYPGSANCNSVTRSIPSVL